MIDPYKTQTSFLALTGQLDMYRSGQTGRIRNDGDVRHINGFAIDVTGSTAKVAMPLTFTPGNGVEIVESEAPAGPLAPSTLTACLQFQEVPEFSAADRKAAESGSGYVTAVIIPKDAEMLFNPVGAEPQTVEGLGYFPGDVFNDAGKMADHLKKQVVRSEELARIEAKLSEEHGVPVKLAFDPLAEEYVMLRPGQPGYDRVKSAQEVFVRTMRDDLGKQLSIGDAVYRDLFPQYREALAWYESSIARRRSAGFG